MSYMDTQFPLNDDYLIFYCRVRAGQFRGNGYSITLDGEEKTARTDEFMFFHKIANDGKGIYNSIQEGMKRINMDELTRVSVSMK